MFFLIFASLVLLIQLFDCCDRWRIGTCDFIQLSPTSQIGSILTLSHLGSLLFPITRDFF